MQQTASIKTRRFVTIFNILPGEEPLIGSLILLAFLMELIYVLTQSVAFGVFLADHGSQALPYSYIVISIFAPLAAALYMKAGQWAYFPNALKLNLAFLGTICLLTWLGLISSFSRSVSFALPLLAQIVVNLGSLVVWQLAGRVLTLGQTKRLFPLLISGAWTANILGGLLIQPLVKWIDAPNLLLPAVVIFCLSLLVTHHITGRYLLPDVPQQKTRPLGGDQPSKGMFRNPYIPLIFAYIILWWVTYFFLDNIFADGAAARFSDINELTVFRGQLSAVTGILALFSSAVLASRVIGRFGLQAGLLIEVLVVTLIVVVLVVTESLGGSAIFIFALVAFAKLTNIALGYSISQAAYGILFQPLPVAIRGNVQTMADGVFQPIASGLAGISILVLTNGWDFDYPGLSYVYLVFSVALLVVIVLLSRNYVRALSQAITKRRLGESPMAIADSASIRLLRDRLHDPHPGLAMYALRKLENLDPASIADDVPRLIQHPSPDVRSEAYSYIERSRLYAVLEDVSRQLDNEPIPSVKGAGLRALAAIAGDESRSQIVDALDQSDPYILRGALVGLLKHQGALPAEALLMRLSTSSRAGDRILAAQVLGEVGQPWYVEVHKTLLQDPDSHVRKAAIQAAETSGHADLHSVLIDACCSTETSYAAAQALSSIGPGVLPAIEHAFVQPDAPPQQILTLCRVLGRIGGTRAHSLLFSSMDSPDSEIRSQILIALSERGFHAEKPSRILGLVRREVQEILWIQAILATIKDLEAALLLAAALKQYITSARDRLLLLSSFVFDTQSLLSVREAVLRGSPSQRAYALEIIETQLPPDWKAIIMPIMNEDMLGHAIADPNMFPPDGEFNLPDQLQLLMTGSREQMFSDWIRACAIYTAARLNLSSCRATIETIMHDSKGLVHETACRAMGHFSTNGQRGMNNMLSTIEKVLALRKVDMFQQTPDNVLADVAELLDEIDVAENAPIFNEGEPGDAMYIIVDGRVRVHTAERFLNYLGESDVFGEMALLDPAPRLATVTTVEPTRVFRLEHSAFSQLMSERPEVATGIIRVLTRHLRKRVQDLSQLENRVRELEQALKST